MNKVKDIIEYTTYVIVIVIIAFLLVLTIIKYADYSIDKKDLNNCKELALIKNIDYQEIKYVRYTCYIKQNNKYIELEK